MRKLAALVIALFVAGPIAWAQAPASSVVVGAVKIVAPECDGFQKLGDVPQLAAILKSVSPRNSIQVTLCAPNEICDLLKKDAATPVSRYVYIFATKRLENEAQTSEKFQELVNKAKERQQTELKSLPTAPGDATVPPKELDPTAGMKAGDSRAIPQLVEGTDYLTVPIYLCCPVPNGPAQPTFLVTAMSFVRVRERVIFIHVTSFYKSKADLDWVMAASAKWVPALLAANADAPVALVNAKEE